MNNSQINTPPQPENSVRVTLTLSARQRIDAALVEEFRKQTIHSALKNMSRAGLKALFKKRRVQIKGQNAVPSSLLAVGTTYIDILGFPDLK